MPQKAAVLRGMCRASSHRWDSQPWRGGSGQQGAHDARSAEALFSAVGCGGLGREEGRQPERGRAEALPHIALVQLAQQPRRPGGQQLPGSCRVEA